MSNERYVDMDKKAELLEASELTNKGDYNGACKLLEHLCKLYPDSHLIVASLANAYWNLDRLDDAITYYKVSTKLSPKFEQASLGLFHCLWEQDKREVALEEVKRFQTISYSKDYEEIVKEINEKSESEKRLGKSEPNQAK